MVYVWLADFVVAVHVAYVACVVFGLLLVLAGWALGWGWVHNRWFRGIHLAMILGVVARTTVLTDCPLTTWETVLRDWGGQVNLEGSRVGYVLHLVIHPGLPTWSYPVIYVLFAILVVATLWIVPVAWRSPRAVPIPYE
jgi:Protein of Unknown function (DUF2784)